MGRILGMSSETFKNTAKNSEAMRDEEILYRMSTNEYGLCMVAAKDLEAGTIVDKWQGKIVDSYDEVPKPLKLYALLIDDSRWLVPENDCMYVNHSCEPNCEVNEKLEIVTLKPVKEGEELCFDYVVTDEGENPVEWNDEWNFECKCKSSKCRGKIDEYVYEDGTPFVRKKQDK